MKEKLIELLDEVHHKHLGKEYTERLGTIADHLIANGVRLETKQATSDETSEENKRIEELEAELAEREKAVIQLRKQWQDAEMHICTMCGHFNHKMDGNIVYGNKTCGEIVGYPYCAGKFTPWIPVTERLPEKMGQCVCRYVFGDNVEYPFFQVLWYFANLENPHFQHEGSMGLRVTHWMPLPEPPKEVE